MTKNFTSLAKCLSIQLALSLCLAVFACKKDDDKSESTADTEDNFVPPPTAGAEEKALLTSSSTNIAAVHENMIPGSLASASAELMLQGGDNPCANTAGFFDCQPNLLKLYLDLAKKMVSFSAQMTSLAGVAIEKVAIPSSGTFTPPATAEGGIVKIDYKVESETDYIFLLHSATGPFLHLTVNGSVINVKADFAYSPEEDEDSPEEGKIETEIDFTDTDNFTADIKILGMGCQDSDVRAPSSIAINMKKADGVWQGKAMMYMPRWLVDDSTACTFTPTNASKMFIYTDFVGDDEGSSMNLYMMPNSVSTAAAIANYPASAFCDNFGICNNGYGFGDQNPIASYENSACITTTASTWGAACSSANTLISTPTFSDPSLWYLPSDFQNATVTVPKTL
jgi:hypothetical protein